MTPSMKALSRDPHVRNIQRQMMEKIPGIILPSDADQRPVRAMEREALAHQDDAVTVRRTSLVYSAEALEPVYLEDEPHPLGALAGIGEPTLADYRRQLADVGTALRLAKDEARAKSLAGLHMSQADVDKHAAYIGQLKAAQWRLTKLIAVMDGDATGPHATERTA